MPGQLPPLPGRWIRHCFTASDDEHPSFRLNVVTFSFLELSAATADFSKNHEIGSGGSGKVYEGHLPHIGKVAVKRFSFDATRSETRKNEFLREVYVLNSVNHPNIVKLFGCCSEGSERLLVYEYLPLGNLRECLSDDKIDMGWDTRMKIALGVARGLEQLHLKANPPIIHLDFKATNILLDEDFQPKISDFGLAKIAPTGDELIAKTVGWEGTPGYVAPEYPLRAFVTTRSDIYSFGVVLLEIITGRKAIDCTKPDAEQNLASWSRSWNSGSSKLLRSTARSKLNDQKNCQELVDPRLKGRVSMDVLSMALAVAKKCVSENHTHRPEIHGVIEGLLNVISKPHDRQDKESSPSSSTPRHGVRIHTT